MEGGFLSIQICCTWWTLTPVIVQLYCIFIPPCSILKSNVLVVFVSCLCCLNIYQVFSTYGIWCVHSFQLKKKSFFRQAQARCFKMWWRYVFSLQHSFFCGAIEPLIIPLKLLMIYLFWRHNLLKFNIYEGQQFIWTYPPRCCTALYHLESCLLNSSKVHFLLIH